MVSNMIEGVTKVSVFFLFHERDDAILDDVLMIEIGIPVQDEISLRPFPYQRYS